MSALMILSGLTQIGSVSNLVLLLMSVQQTMIVAIMVIVPYFRIQASAHQTTNVPTHWFVMWNLVAVTVQLQQLL